MLKVLLRPKGFMPTTRKQLLYLIMGSMFGLLLMGAKPLAAQDACKLPIDATTKVFDIPSHSYATITIGGNSTVGESIYIGGKIYAKYNGKWMDGGSTTKEMKELSEKNRQGHTTTCRFLKDETVGGEMASEYSVHDVSPKSTSDSQIWVSKAKGLPLRSEIELDGGKSHMSVRFEYGNVKAPM